MCRLFFHHHHHHQTRIVWFIKPASWRICASRCVCVCLCARQLPTHCDSAVSYSAYCRIPSASPSAGVSLAGASCLPEYSSVYSGRYQLAKSSLSAVADMHEAHNLLWSVHGSTEWQCAAQAAVFESQGCKGCIITSRFALFTTLSPLHLSLFLSDGILFTRKWSP